MTKSKIYFRADASADIGYGHFIRTLALADMLKDDFDCTFYTQDPTEYQRSEVAKVCELKVLPSDNSKYDLFLQELNGDEIVVLDNYFYTTEYQIKIKSKGCKLVCVDDMHDKHYVADVVINHGTDNEQLFSVESYTKLCLGLEWALLRKPFFCIGNKANDKQKDTWLIAFGGSDSYNFTQKYIELLQKDNSNATIYVVVGDAYKFTMDLKKYSNVKVFSSLTASEMAQLMGICENAIVPSSSICIEALSQGCNVYSGYYVDNQKGLYEYLLGNGYINGLGNLSDCQELSKNAKLCAIKDISLLEHIIKYILLFRSLLQERLDGLQFIDYVDLDLSVHRKIFQYRNLYSIRRWMDNTEEISWYNHCSFINSLLHRNDKKYYAAFLDFNLIGCINYTIVSDKIVERGIFITPDNNGKGLASLIETKFDEYLRNKGYDTVIAKVLYENVSSLKFHLKNGFIKTNEEGKYIYFKKKL